MTDNDLRAALTEWLRTRDAAQWHESWSADFRNGYDTAVEEVRAALAASAPDEPRSDLRAALEHVLAAHLPHNMTCLTAAAALASAPDEGPT